MDEWHLMEAGPSSPKRTVPVEITLAHCLLRPWRTGDEVSLVQNANNRNVWNNLRDSFPHPYTLADAERWILLRGAERPATNFAIEVDGAAVGGIGIHPRNDVYRRSAEIGYWLGEHFWGRGIMTEAVRAVVEYGFSTFHICRIQAEVFEWNPASMRVLEKAGFACEAQMRMSIVKNGKVMDGFVYAIVRP